MSTFTRLACADVDYRPAGAVAAAGLFRDWRDASFAAEVVVPIDSVAPYEPGFFYRRELPCVLAALSALPERAELVVIDGYVWLGENRPGLGWHLYDSLHCSVPIVGVAKTRFHDATAAEVRRGRSTRPLYVTSIGLDLAEAASFVLQMHGEFRIPTLLKRIDQFCRGRIPATSVR